MKKNVRTNIIWILILISCIGLVLYLQANNKIKENKVQRISQDEEESGKEIIKTKEEVEKQYLEEKEISPYMVFEQNKEYYIGNDVLINDKKDDYISDLDSLVLKRKLDKDLEFKIALRNNELDLSKSSYKIYKPVYKDMESKEILGYIEIKKGE